MNILLFSMQAHLLMFNLLFFYWSLGEQSLPSYKSNPQLNTNNWIFKTGHTAIPGALGFTLPFWFSLLQSFTVFSVCFTFQGSWCETQANANVWITKTQLIMHSYECILLHFHYYSWRCILWGASPDVLTRVALFTGCSRSRPGQV